MKLFSKILVAACLISPLAADSIKVRVKCSDGKAMAGLPISVFDSDGIQVAGVNDTDPAGFFTIANSQNYTAPFMLFFIAHDGSTCGAYNVIQSDPTTGFVYLNYYPVDLPCSCSKYNEKK